MSDLKTDYTSEALLRLLTTLQGAPEVEALAAAYLDRCQELEDAAHPMLVQRSIEDSVGDRIDRIGAIVGIPRGGREDDDYRLRVRAEIAILNSDGTEDAITTVVQLLTGQTDPKDISFDESFPKAVTLRARDTAVGGFDVDQDAILTLLRRAISAATEVDYVYSWNEALDTNIFHFSNTADTTEAAATYGTENGSLCGAAI